MVQLKGNRTIDKMRNSKYWKVYVGTAIVVFLILLIGTVSVIMRGCA